MRPKDPETATRYALRKKRGTQCVAAFQDFKFEIAVPGELARVSGKYVVLEPNTETYITAYNRTGSALSCYETGLWPDRGSEMGRNYIVRRTGHKSGAERLIIRVGLGVAPTAPIEVVLFEWKEQPKCFLSHADGQRRYLVIQRHNMEGEWWCPKLYNGHFLLAIGARPEVDWHLSFVDDGSQQPHCSEGEWLFLGGGVDLTPKDLSQEFPEGIPLVWDA